MPVFLIQPIWNFKRDVGKLKEVLLNLGTEVTFIPKHHTVMVFPSHIIKIMDIVYACRCHVIRMYDTPYSADSMEFIIIIMHSLRSIISLVRYSVRIVPLHDVSFDACVQANLYRFGINTAPSIAITTIFVDFFGKESCQFAPGVELMSAIRLG